jgi:hypothetical protein
MEWRTELHILPSTQKLNHSDAVMLIGSCFSQNMGEKLSQYKFRVLSNPFGTVFNPVSVARLLMYACNPSTLDLGQMLHAHGLYVHPDFYKTLADNDRNVAASRIMKAVENAHQFVKKAGFLFITLGTSTAYTLNATGRIVANCHKLPAALFSKGTIDVEEGFCALEASLKALYDINPAIKVVFTVSPVRHTREGIVENSRSKARLHVMIEKIQQAFPGIMYFPAYEWMMDDLRDYRFYQQDLIHPNDMALQYLWEKFVSHFFEKETEGILAHIDKIIKALQHRPATSDHPSYRKLMEDTLTTVMQLEDKFPAMDFNEEKKILLNR